MAAPSSQTLQRLADETGHQLGTLEKVLRLLDVLQEIARDPVLSERLVLKGGTALNVFHLGLDRLSVDIDLNYVGALDRAVMKTERPTVDAALDRLLVSQAYSIRRQPDEHAGGKWLARYASALGSNAALELDVNYMARQPLFGVERMNSRVLGQCHQGRPARDTSKAPDLLAAQILRRQEGRRWVDRGNCHALPKSVRLPLRSDGGRAEVSR